jgi:hypothetical protein
LASDRIDAWPDMVISSGALARSSASWVKALCHSRCSVAPPEYSLNSASARS